MAAGVIRFGSAEQADQLGRALAMHVGPQVRGAIVVAELERYPLIGAGEAIVSTTQRDSYGHRILPDAYLQAVRPSARPVLLDHVWSRPAGWVTALGTADPGRLVARFVLVANEHGHEAMRRLARGTGFSIGWSALRDDLEASTAGYLRLGQLRVRLTDGRRVKSFWLHEISLTPRPTNPGTRLLRRSLRAPAPA